MARILIIDDEPAIRRSVRRILEIPGHEVEEVADGLAGIALHATRPFDIIITDLRMPDFDGIEVITGLRRIDSQVQIILISGGHQEDARSHSAELGPIWHLAKPFTLQDLQSLVLQIVGGAG